MDRREFIKKSAMATAAGVVMASPIGSVLAQEDHTATRKMKVLIINGSPRKAGNTFLALTEAAHQLEKNGIDTEIIQIGTQAIHGHLLRPAQRHSAESCTTPLLCRLACDAEQTCIGSGRMSSWRCFGCLPNHAHALPDAQHACGHFAVLEHCLRSHRG